MDKKETNQDETAGNSKDALGQMCVCPKCKIFMEKPKANDCDELVCPTCGGKMVAADPEYPGPPKYPRPEKKDDDEDEEQEDEQDTEESEDAPPEECVCPKCGEKVKKERGTRCAEMKCPKCGTKMLGYPMPKSDDTEPAGDEEAKDNKPTIDSIMEKVKAGQPLCDHETIIAALVKANEELRKEIAKPVVDEILHLTDEYKEDELFSMDSKDRFRILKILRDSKKASGIPSTKKKDATIEKINEVYESIA